LPCDAEASAGGQGHLGADDFGRNLPAVAPDY
jgi:hypothetical protein